MFWKNLFLNKTVFSFLIIYLQKNQKTNILSNYSDISQQLKKIDQQHNIWLILHKTILVCKHTYLKTCFYRNFINEN